jgi:K+-transporting ATPase ATPase A chain
MSTASWLQFVVLIVLLVATAPVLGRYMARVYGDDRAPGDRLFGVIERPIYRLCRVDPTSEQRWTTYAFSVIGFSLFSFVVLYAVMRLQGSLPFNPVNLPGVGEHLSFNTAVSLS